MSQLVADANLSANLTGLTNAVDIVDASGRKLGRYLPERAAAEPFCPWEPTLTPEDAARIADEPGAGPLADVWKRLGVR